MSNSTGCRTAAAKRIPGAVAAGMIDDLAAQMKCLAQAQARCAELMVEFADTRRTLDQTYLDELRHCGGKAQFKAAEFACTEISLAVTASKFAVQRTVAMVRRVKAEAPDAWDAWCTGDIDQDKVVRINRALRRLVRQSSKELLNSVVVDLAVCRTPEILGRCLNQFIARVEPDLQKERLHRSLEDRYVSVRPDLDGVSFMSAAVSSVDAHAIDHVLRAAAAIAAPDDLRTLQQRRADALVDILLGRVSNGCHVVWDTNSDADDHLDDSIDDDRGERTNRLDVPGDAPDRHCHDSRDDLDDCDDETNRATPLPDTLGPDCQGSRNNLNHSSNLDDDWGLPASAFRPDPPGSTVGGHHADREQPGAGVARVIRCSGGGDPRPLPVTIGPVTIGVVVSVQSLFDVGQTPGQLMDRSASVPADVVRRLAEQPGTLFYRLLTDPRGNLLDASEMGRFPSGKLGTAIKFRDGVCANPSCTVPAIRCDLDHLVPVPAGLTTAANLSAECRHEHRAKTHGGHSCTRSGPHTTEWTTPTGHRYTSHDEALPVENWPGAAPPDQ